MRRRDVIVFAVAAAVCFLLKLHYSLATPSDLRWVLAPTTAGVSFLTGASFAFDPAHGYVSHELRYIIAPVCAGVNFAIIAYASLVIATRRLVVTALAAYAMTVFANTLRIVIAIQLRGESWGWLTAERLHVLVGIVVYLAVLLGVFALVRRRWSWLPLLPYALVALVVPLLNGASDDAFWAHAGLLVGVMAAALALGFALRHVRARLGKHGVRELPGAGLPRRSGADLAAGDL